MSEEDKLQAAMDVAEAVYFIHNLSNPVVHQVSLRNHKKSLVLVVHQLILNFFHIITNNIKKQL